MLKLPALFIILATSVFIISSCIVSPKATISTIPNSRNITTDPNPSLVTITSPVGGTSVYPSGLFGVWGKSPSDVFAVGSGGSILHYDGKSWRYLASYTTSNLHSLWGTSSSDIFAVGTDDYPTYMNTGGTILHYDGKSWSTVWSLRSDNSGNGLYGIWGSSPSNVFAVGNGILHYDGKAWRSIESVKNSLYGVWGTSSTSVFAVGSEGTILHYDGNSWGVMASGMTSNIFAVWGTSSSDVFAAGTDVNSKGIVLGGTIIHYDGKAWSHLASIAKNDLRSFWGDSASNIFAVGLGGVILHFDGKSFTNMNMSNITNNKSGPSRLFGVWGSSSSEIFAVGDLGTIVHYDGKAWNSTQIAIATTPPSSTVLPTSTSMPSPASPLVPSVDIGARFPSNSDHIQVTYSSFAPAVSRDEAIEIAKNWLLTGFKMQADNYPIDATVALISGDVELSSSHYIQIGTDVKAWIVVIKRLPFVGSGGPPPDQNHPVKFKSISQANVAVDATNGKIITANLTGIQKRIPIQMIDFPVEYLALKPSEVTFLASGKIIFENGYLRIKVDTSTSYLPFWPNSFNVVDDNGVLTITDNNTESLAKVGDNIQVFGRIVNPSEDIQNLSVFPLAADVKGPFWLVDSISQ